VPIRHDTTLVTQHWIGVGIGFWLKAIGEESRSWSEADSKQNKSVPLSRPEARIRTTQGV